MKKKRSLKHLKRKHPFRSSAETVLIVCEGEKTEPKYFRSLARRLNLRSVKVEGERCDSAAIAVVNYALRSRSKRNQSDLRSPFDQVWCVMDVEMPQQESLPDAIAKALKENLNVALSNPCFEYWYLLHFEKTAPSFPSSPACRKELQRHSPSYKKGSSHFFDQIYAFKDTAIQRAKEVLREKGFEDNVVSCYPSTDVYRLVEELMKLSS